MRLFALFPLPGALFFSLLPIVLAPAVFRRGFKALHCKRRRISIADRLYFFLRPGRRGEAAVARPPCPILAE
jgi:hypothetical protein